MNWNKILNWKLLSGSHKFPGPDGGTCINEAAIVAAGFQYRSVSSTGDCPPCFSRVLSTYAIQLNDSLPDDLRQSLLMPFVTRLAGTADTYEIERERLDFIVLGLIRTVLPISLRGWRDAIADQCEAAVSYADATKAVNGLGSALARTLTGDIARDDARALALDLASALHLALARAPDCALARALISAEGSALNLASALGSALGRARALDPASAAAAVKLLDGAMKIGKQAEPIECELVIDRLAKIRQPELLPG